MALTSLCGNLFSIMNAFNISGQSKFSSATHESSLNVKFFQQTKKKRWKFSHLWSINFSTSYVVLLFGVFFLLLLRGVHVRFPKSDVLGSFFHQTSAPSSKGVLVTVKHDMVKRHTTTFFFI